MRILVTAGNTQTPVDRVRCITNALSGRTNTHDGACRRTPPFADTSFRYTAPEVFTLAQRNLGGFRILDSPRTREE